MNMRISVRRAVQQALMAGCAVSTAAVYLPTANAQQAEAVAMEEIVVTGSRLRRTRDFVEVSPVQTIELDQIQASGNLTLESTLNRFPQLGPDTSSVSNHTSGPGVLTANLRSLGASRTLVLVDGRRFVPADVNGLTDLATIPDMLIERVEIVTGGASSVYGSDAIAGAVNFVMRDSFDGVEVRYQYGETSRNDVESHKVDVLLGMNSNDGKGNVVMHAGYTKRGGAFLGDRSFSAQPLIPNAQGELIEFGVATIPSGFIGLNQTQLGQIVGVDFESALASCPDQRVEGLRFDENGTPLPFCRPTDQYNYAAPNFLIRPLERWQANALGSYRMSDNLEAYAQVFYVKTQNEFQQAPLALFPTTPGQEPGTVLINNADTNPLFQQPLRDFFADNRDFFDPDGDGVYTVRNTARVFEEFGMRNVSYTRDSMNFTTGLRGDLDLGQRDWAWDSFFQFARTDSIESRVGLMSRSRFAAGLDVIEVDGEPACRVNLLGCVPVNIFGLGTPSAEAVNYLRTSTNRRSQFTRTVAGASATGDLLELPAGTMPAAFGVEWRREAFQDRPDDALQSGDIGTTPAIPVEGNFNIFEVFAETRIPLLNDLPAIQGLAVELSARYADYSTIGSVLAWNTSLDWEINDQLRARAGYGRAIRAPNLNDLFAPVSAGFRGGSDPCWTVNNPTEAQRALCIEQGVPAEFIDTFTPGASQGFTVEVGGNPDLTEEEARTLTVGFVYTPSRSLSMAVDYYRVEVDDAIAEVAFQSLVNSCFDTLDRDSVACRSITRLSSGNIDTVRAPKLNVAERKVDGLDVQINYGMDDLPGFLSLPGQGATLDFTLINSWQFENTTRPFPGSPATDCAGYYDGICSSGTNRVTPAHRALLRSNYRSGNLRITPELTYVGRMKLTPGSRPNEVGTVSSWMYVNLTAGYEISDNLSLYGGINNLFDKSPPVLGYRAGGDTNTEPQLYDTLGRFFFIGASAGFGGR